MIPVAISELARACKGRLVCKSEEENILITSIVTDSRKVSKGTLFGAIKGARADGHDFIGQVASNGASGVLCEKAPVDTDIPYILVPSTLKALQAMAAYVLKKADIPVVAITGSVGKTSTKEMIAAVLSKKFDILKTSGNHNNALGLPLTVFELEKEHQAAVLEHGISRFGEMSVLAEITRPDVCVFTNIGDCHLEDLGSRDGVFKAKGEMFDFCSDDAKFVFNGDDAILKEQKEIRGKRPCFFGFSKGCEITAENVRQLGLKGVSFTLITPESRFDVTVPAPGNHMVINALAAAAVGRIFGLSDEEIREGLGSYEPVGGRFNIIETDELCIIDDCYNANPVSMKASLKSLSFAEGRKVAVLGDMGELGNDTEKLHAGVGEFLGSIKIDVLCCAGELSRHIFEAAKNADKTLEAHMFADKKELIAALPGILHKNDTILVKASHFCGFEDVVKAVKEMDL